MIRFIHGMDLGMKVKGTPRGKTVISKGRGDQIRLLVKLYRILDSTDGLTVNDIVKRAGMSTRQVYR